MRFEPFQLDRWIERHRGRDLIDLAGSVGAPWTVGALLDLEPQLDWRDRGVLYAPIGGSEELRRAIAAHVATDPEHVFVTTGAAEAIAILAADAAEPGRNVVLPDPGYPAFSGLPRAFGLEVRRYQVDRERGFALDPDAVARLIDARTALVFVNTPHNPSGACCDASGIDAVARAAAAAGEALVVVDQVFHPIELDRPTPPVATRPGVVALGDMSKALSLSGLRIGWIVEPDPTRRQRYRDLRAYFTLGSGEPVEALAALALRHTATLLERTRGRARTNRAALAEVLGRRADVVAWVPPAGGLVAFPWLRSGESTRDLAEGLARDGVLIAPGDTLGHPDHFRIALASVEEETFQRAVETLDCGLAHLERRASA
jgi:aspartate/methionine/tyrosine aminotransferase